MTYKHYILKNGLSDSVESYRKWLEETASIYNMMNPKMQDQYIHYTYNLRFINH